MVYKREKICIRGGESDESDIGDRELGGREGGGADGVGRDCCVHVFFGHGSLSCAVCYTLSKISREQ